MVRNLDFSELGNFNLFRYLFMEITYKEDVLITFVKSSFTDFDNIYFLLPSQEEVL